VSQRTCGGCGRTLQPWHDYCDEEFLPRMAAYANKFLLWDENLQEIPNDNHLADDKQPLILVTQDELILNANNGKHFIWIHPDHQPLRKKRRGQGLHVSDFLTPIGRLGHGDACVIMKCGGDISWTGDRLLDQVIQKAIPAFEAQFPGCKALFAFDNSRNHCKFVTDALRVSEMNLEPGGKSARLMRDTYVLDINHPAGGYIQSLQLPNGIPKGLRKGLLEPGLWPDNRRFLAQWSIKSTTGMSAKPNPRCPDGGSCCTRALLGAQSGIRTQKNQNEETIIKAAHEVIYYPAFHCEINFIEYFWGAAKHYTHERCEYDFESLKPMVPEALAIKSVDLEVLGMY